MKPEINLTFSTEGIHILPVVSVGLGFWLALAANTNWLAFLDARD